MRSGWRAGRTRTASGRPQPLPSGGGDRRGRWSGLLRGGFSRAIRTAVRGRHEDVQWGALRRRRGETPLWTAQVHGRPTLAPGPGTTGPFAFRPHPLVLIKAGRVATGGHSKHFINPPPRLFHIRVHPIRFHRVRAGLAPIIRWRQQLLWANRCRLDSRRPAPAQWSGQRNPRRPIVQHPLNQVGRRITEPFLLPSGSVARRGLNVGVPSPSAAAASANISAAPAPLGQFRAQRARRCSAPAGGRRRIGGLGNGRSPCPGRGPQLGLWFRRSEFAYAVLEGEGLAAAGVVVEVDRESHGVGPRCLRFGCRSGWTWSVIRWLVSCGCRR